MLSTQETEKVRKLVERAARIKFGAARIRKDNGQAAYEHGQWYYQILDEEDEIVSFSVVDASPGIANLGIDFEEL